MIPKKPGPDLIRAGHRFSEKIMLYQKTRAGDDPALGGVDASPPVWHSGREGEPG